MTLRVRTSNVRFDGADRLDITRKSAGPEGVVFAPSWSILRPALDARRAGRDEEHWPTYVERFLAEMRVSFRAHRATWDELLARETVTLVCYCRDRERCHRTLLARDILTRLGAEYAGEAPAPGYVCIQFDDRTCRTYR